MKHWQAEDGVAQFKKSGLRGASCLRAERRLHRGTFSAPEVRQGFGGKYEQF